MPADHRVDQAARQLPHHLEHLGAVVARREIGRRLEVLAHAAGVGRGDHHLRAPPAQRRGFRRQRFGQRRDRQAADVGRERHRQRPQRHQADDADADAGTFDQRRRLHVGPRHRPAGDVEEVRGQEREPGLRGPRLERAAGIVVPRRLVVPGVDGAELEVVVAQRRGGIAEGVVGVHDQRALREVRLDAALPGVAGVEQDHRAAVGGAGGAQVGEVAAEQRQSAAPVIGEDAAMQVGGADDRDRHRAVVEAGGERRTPRTARP